MPVQTNHRILGGKVQLYRRGDSGYWWCAASLGGKQRRASTKEENLALAKTLAEDWYLELRGKSRAGLLRTEKTFQQAADQFTKEYGIITEGQRSERWVEGHKIRLRLHLVPFFGEFGVSEVTAGKVQEYRVHRATTPPTGGKQPIKMTKGATPVYQAPSRSTLHDEIVTLRLVLKTAIRHGWLDHLPDLSPPIGRRARSCIVPGSVRKNISRWGRPSRRRIIRRSSRLSERGLTATPAPDFAAKPSVLL